MALEVMSSFAYYATHVLKGFLDIATGKEEFIYDDEGNIISKLPSKRKQVLVFIKNFLKEPVSLEIFLSISIRDIGKNEMNILFLNRI